MRDGVPTVWLAEVSLASKTDTREVLWDLTDPDGSNHTGAHTGFDFLITTQPKSRWCCPPTQLRRTYE